MPPSASRVDELSAQGAAITVVPSGNPVEDASLVRKILVAPRFVGSTGSTGSSGNETEVELEGSTIVVIEDDVAPSIVIAFVDFGSGDARASSADPFTPVSTVIVKSNLIVSLASSTSGLMKCRIDDDISWAVIQLSDGGKLLLAASLQSIYEYANNDLPIDVVGEKMADVSIAAAPMTSEGGEGGEPPYKFPSLAISILANKRIIPGFKINTRVGVPVESDLFIGKVLVMMRPPNPEDDPYYNEKVFSKKRRRFEIQIQGKFKYVPSGTVWCGFEVTEEMKLGLVSRGLCNLLLRLVSKTVPGDMHFSFGDKDNFELPHISFPAWTLFDKVVVTKPGETPPPLGDVLPEDSKAASARKRSSNTGEWNTEDVYSFSYHSMYLDFPIWHIVNLPTADIDLKSFWRDSDLRIVVYENGPAGSSQKGKHLQSDNKYIAGIQAEYLGFADESINDMIEEKDAMNLDQKRLSTIARSISTTNLATDRDNAESDNGSNNSISPGLEGWDISTVESDGEETTFYDAKGMLRTDSEGALSEGGQIYVETNSFEDQVETSFVDKSMPDSMLLFDLLCPAWIDLCSDQRGKYTKVYAFTTMTNSDIILRTGREFAQLFSLMQAKVWADETCSPRLSNSERQRRIMGYTLAAYENVPSTRCKRRCRALKEQEGCRFGNVFLQREPPSDSKAKVRNDNVLFACYVGRALSERHWVEEWAVVTESLISFFHPDHKRPSYRIRRNGILGVKKMRESECPHFPSHHFLALETVSRVIYLVFRSAVTCDEVLNILQNQGGTVITPIPSTRNLSPLTFDDPTEEYLHKSSVYKCQHRRLLNNRKFAFDSLGKIGFDNREGIDHIHPLTLVQNILRKALHPKLIEGSDRIILDDFLDAASELKSANMTGLSETEKTAFYINLYHCMVMHGFLLFGPPVSGGEFVNHFGKVGYEVGDDIFSLKELEHNIIRANMSCPSQFVSRFVLPKSVYKHALLRGDFRINFAINSGSRSNPASVQIFSAKDLDFQLDMATRDYLKVAKVSASGKSLTLPRICQWYSNDFGNGRHQDVVRLVLNYLNEPDQRRLPSFLSEVHVRHLGYDFKCRPLVFRSEK